MALSGSVSTILGATQKLLQAKAQAAWKQVATADKAGNQPGAANKQTPQNAATAAIMDMVDPATQEKLRAMRKDADSLVEKLSSGGETKKEAAMRKADDAKRKLKALKLQAQMAAASGDKKAAARIAREVSQLAKELGQAAKDYGGTDAVTATAGAKPTAEAAQTVATGAETKGETAAAATAATPAATAAQPGATPASASAAGQGEKGQAASAAATPVQAQPSETVADKTEGAESQAADEENPTSAETAEKGADAAAGDADKAAASGDSDKAAADEAKAGTATTPGSNPTNAAQADLQAKRDAIIKEGAARKAAGEFYNDVRGSMSQLRSILDQMKRLARRDGEPGPGTAAQMDQASREMVEGEQMLQDAAGAGSVSLPSGSLVQISV